MFGAILGAVIVFRFTSSVRETRDSDISVCHRFFFLRSDWLSFSGSNIFQGLLGIKPGKSDSRSGPNY